MLSIILETLSSLKICLLIALFTGLLFGYLYTKLKAHEFHHPDVKKFKNNISSHAQSLAKIESKQKSINKEIEDYEFKLKETNESILKYKEQFLSQKELHVNMLTKGKEFKSKYEDKKSILDHYTGEIDKIKKECRLDDISNIEENKESIKKLIEDKKVKLREKEEKFAIMQNKLKSLDFDNHKFKEKFHELNRKNETMDLKIVEKSDALTSLEKGFVKEYEVLYNKISVSHDRVKEYKEKLRKLKDY